MLLDSPSLIPISVPGSPSATSFRFDSPKIHGARGQPESAENLLEASVPGPPHLKNRLNTETTRWGCWSALTNPPRFRSGTLVLGPDPETPCVVEQSSSNASRRSQAVPRTGSFDARPRFVPSVPRYVQTLKRRLWAVLQSRLLPRALVGCHS